MNVLVLSLLGALMQFIRGQRAGFLALAWALCSAALLIPSQRAQAQTSFTSAGSVVQTQQVKAQLLAHAPDGVGVGKPMWLGLQIEHQPQWHTYWKNSGDSGQPTEFAWRLPAGIAAAETNWPVPKKIWIGSLANYGYEDTLLLPVPIEVSTLFKPDLLKTEVEIGLKASWLVCKQECIPQEGEFSIRVPVNGSTALHQAAFDAAWARVPKDWRSRAQAEIAGSQLRFSVPQLPSALHGKALQLFPETPDVLENGARLTAEQSAAGVGSGQPMPQWSQAWQGSVWQASFPMSSVRSASPSEMPLVLTADGVQAYRVVAQVQGAWPAAVAPAQVPPALAQALQANARQATGAQAVSKDGLSSIWAALLAALLGGLILNVMPCVLPVLAIKVFGLAKTSGARERVSGGLAYTAGVVISLMALGGLMLALRAGGQALGWGFQLQSPSVVAALALLFTLIALNFLGVFELAHALPSRVLRWQVKNPTIDSFLTGVLAVAVASPCTAPFMGASLGFALGLPAWQALAVFACLGLGLALPYLAVSMLPALARWMPQPGAWMGNFKIFMAFPMFATVVWLVWVLGQQTGIHGAASLLVLLLAVSLVVWTMGLPGRSRTVLGATAVLILAALSWVFGGHVLRANDSPTNQTDARWQPWSQELLAQTLAQGKPVFVDFTAAWCVTCQFNKTNTLSDAAVLKSFSEKGVKLMRADWTRRDPAITQALNALGRSGVPVYVLYQSGSSPVVMSEILSVTRLQTELAKL